MANNKLEKEWDRFMKTVEEKAKAYDEVREKIAIRFGSNVADEIFSQFEMSEDERIRLKLIEAVKGDMVVGGTKDKQLAIDWLEKQGEGTDYANKEYWRGYNEGKQEILDKYAELEKQGEQKPQGKSALEAAQEEKVDNQNCVRSADKVEPKFKVGDKIYLKPEYRMPDDDTPIANTVFEIRAIDDKHYRFDGSYIFIEDQDKYELVEQKPAWSEEDERMWSQVINEIEAIKSNSSTVFEKNIAQDKIDWLKFLKDRVQPKQEWSEEDYNFIKELCDLLASISKNGYVGKYYTVDLVEKLKSLKPQNRWKPNDEQIKALYEATLEGEPVEALETLLSDLKKLKSL